MSAAGERGETARKYGRGDMSAPDTLALLAVVKDISARLVMAESRMERQDAEAVKRAGQTEALTGRVLALENPEKPEHRAHRGLRELQEKVEAADPGRVKGFEQEKWEARQKLKSTEK